MARSMKRRRQSASVNIPAAPKKPQNVAEMKEYFNSEEYREQVRREAFAAAEQAATSIRDVTKTSTKTVSAFSKDSLTTYLQNIGSNESNLRNLSRYLFYRCNPYYRLVMYNANMFELGARTIIPKFSLTEEIGDDEILASYQETANMLDVMNLQYEFLKAYATCFREDVFYGCAYYDETGFFIFPLDPDYCIISGIYGDGSFAFHMDVTYFRSRQTLLEYLDEPFTSMYRQYESDGQKYQPMPDEYSVCLKARAEDWDVILPPFSGLLNSIINLIDLEDIQAVADEQEIYKMIWLEMETLTGSDLPDDWKVNPTIMVEYFNRMVNDALPPYISAAIVPGKLDAITFNSDAASDTNKVSTATQTLFNSAGGAQILNSSTISGTTAFTAAVKSDSEMAISMLLPQTQGIVNRLLASYISDPCKVIFYEVSAYTKDTFKETILQDAQYGLPNKLLINSLNGISEMQTLALNNFEENILGLSGMLVPLQSSYTQSGDSADSAGRPASDSTDLTDDGEASKDKADTAKG